VVEEGQKGHTGYWLHEWAQSGLWGEGGQSDDRSLSSISHISVSLLYDDKHKCSANIHR
jgi:hypothetical protein